MTKYSYDKKSLLRDDKRWFPLMGEIHYSRYPEKYWKEALLRMKAGGIDIVSAYVIWIHHEEIEGEWDFSGNKDLRTFVKTIQECGLTMLLRIGPWIHGEVRNGGFPDWLIKKCPENRTNNEAYFAEVEKFYKKIFQQVKGLLLQDGGPIIGLQIENEYGHCGGLCGEEGQIHMQRLLSMAKEAGFNLPIYTATGWGGAVTAGMLPVMGGYCDAPWDPRTCEIEPSGNFIFTYERNDHAIGSDYGLGEGITFDMNKVPYLTAELGGGLQVTYKRRPVAQPKDIAAMSIAKMGSGCNLLGYYMYHGGTNPDGKLTTLEENTASGSINDLPVKNYDFRAALGEYGQANGTYRELRRIALFIHDFGQELCEMDTYIPEDNPLNPQNFKDLRYSWRYNKSGSGYLFINNYQRHHEMAQHNNLKIKIPEQLQRNGLSESPELTVCKGDFYILPFSSSKDYPKNAIPLCLLQGKNKSYPVYWRYPKDCKSKEAVSFEADSIILSQEASLNAQKVICTDKSQALLISQGLLYPENGEWDGNYLLEERSKNELILLKEINGEMTIKILPENKGKEEVKAPEVKVLEETTLSDTTKCWKISVAAVDKKVIECNDVFLKINYCGNCARLYQKGKLLADHIFMGQNYPWEIGLKRFGLNGLEFTLEIDCLKKGQGIYLEEWPDFGSSNKLCKLNSISSEYSFLRKINLN
ncbi:MAG: beta-galactosidase [Treponema sp.]|nr:beta-galactosidase [Treponema sp.]